MNILFNILEELNFLKNRPNTSLGICPPEIKSPEFPFIIISYNMAKKLDVSLHDTILASFSRIRENNNNTDTYAAFSNCIISGIYKTDLKEYDDKICLINANFLIHKFKIKSDSKNFYEILIKESKYGDDNR